jgi:hypothetical protein
MIFTLDVRRARKGDCLLLHYGTPADPGLVLIDGGPSQVYAPQLKPRLAAIRTARHLTATQPLPVDLLMVSHIDDDHIKGILELTRELVEARDEHRPLPLRIRGFWHNSFDDIIGNDPEHLLAAIAAHFGAAALGGAIDVEGLDPDAARVLASVPQGFRLRDDVRKLQLPVNPQFDGALVMASAVGESLDLGRGLSLTVAGPLKPELKALQKDHDDFLREQAAGRHDLPLAAFTDTSVPNLSSIVVLAECGGRRMLLTGDARGDKILKGLELAGLSSPGGTLHVDVLKMPHHGSDRNMTRGFLERVTADHYVFSGNGEHGNPERSTLDMLRLARGAAPYTVHLTYPIADIDVERRKDWEKEQAKERTRRLTNPAAVVRDDWSDAANSLGAFFATHPQMAARVRIVPAGGTHLIELLDPVGV